MPLSPPEYSPVTEALQLPVTLPVTGPPCEGKFRVTKTEYFLTVKLPTAVIGGKTGMGVGAETLFWNSSVTSSAKQVPTGVSPHFSKI